MVITIDGLGVNGKSTLANSLASKYNCTHYELDCLDFYLSGDMSIKDAIGNEDGLVAFINKKNLKPGLNLNNNKLNMSVTMNVYGQFQNVDRHRMCRDSCDRRCIGHRIGR